MNFISSSIKGGSDFRIYSKGDIIGSDIEIRDDNISKEDNKSEGNNENKGKDKSNNKDKNDNKDKSDDKDKSNNYNNSKSKLAIRKDKFRFKIKDINKAVKSSSIRKDI